MKIGIAGAVSLNLLDINFKKNEIPEGVRSFPLIANIANGFLKAGHDLVIYTYAHNIEKPIVIEKERVTICIAVRKSSPGRRFFKDEIKSLSNLIRKYPSDIVNAQWTYEYALSALSCNLPTVVTVRDHATTILKYQFDAFRVVKWFMNYSVLKKATHLIANSQYLKELIDKEKYKVKVISNFYDSKLEEFYQRDKKSSNKIITVSNGFGKRKNIKTALRAFKLIKQKFPQMEYHLIGKGLEKGGGAYNYALKNNLTNGVFFLGAMNFESVIREVSLSKILLHPSKEETFGNSVLEAMVVGTPVVGGKKSGNIPYLLNFGEAGILCDVSSPNSIADGVISVLKDEGLYSSIRMNAQEYAKENYREEGVIKRLLDFYHEVINDYENKNR